MKKIYIAFICMIALLSGCSLNDSDYSLKIGTDDIFIGMSIEDLIKKGYVVDTNLDEELDYNTYYEDLFSVTKDSQEVMKIQIGNFSLEDGKMKDGSIKRIELSGNVIFNDVDYTDLSIEEAMKKLGDNATYSEQFNTIDLRDNKVNVSFFYNDEKKLNKIWIDRVEK